ncbi:MAG: hypothetical protein LBU32_33060 [Clostridiales bacterium]|jgi:hypothetical protein|nr:hypothetical protein [Clostridiales bacterium]
MSKSSDVSDDIEVNEAPEKTEAEGPGDLESDDVPMEADADSDVGEAEEYDKDKWNEADEGYYQNSIHNPDSKVAQLGKYDANIPENSYEVQAEGNEYKYFSNPDYSKFAEEHGLSDDEMYEKFNKKYLDEEVAGKSCEVQTSHDPESSSGAFGREANYLSYVHGYEYNEDDGRMYPPGEMPEEGSDLPVDEDDEMSRWRYDD